MGRIYTVNLSSVSYTTTVDLVTILPAANIPILIHGFRVWQTNKLGDANESILSLIFVRGNTTPGSGGSAPSGIARSLRDAGASFSARVSDSTIATGGSPVSVYRTGWNIRFPLEIYFPPDLMIPCDAGQTQIALRLADTPAASTTISAAVDVEELV